MEARSAVPEANDRRGVAAIGMFLTTLSFLLTTPGMWAVVDGLLVPSGAGGFIIKDVFLLGAAMLTAAEALNASARAADVEQGRLARSAVGHTAVTNTH